MTRPGDVLEYTLTMKNNGQDHAIACVLRDTLPANVTYVAGSLQVVSGPNAGAKTDAAGDDQMEYLAASRTVVARLGTGATAAAGGQLSIGVTTSVKFRATIPAGTPAGTVIANQARLAFRVRSPAPRSTRPATATPPRPAPSSPRSRSRAASPLSGFVYADANHDASRQASEIGTGVTLWAKLIALAGGNALQVVSVSAASGAYAFTFVAPGTCRVIRDTSNDPTDVTATDPAGWIGTQVASGSRTNVVVGAADVADQDFGMWQGSSVSGAVFRDDGAGGGAANDGVRQAGEAALAGVRMRLAAACVGGGACDSTVSDASGAFTLWLPLAGASGTATVSEVNPSGALSTGGGAGTTGGVYSRATDAVTFTAATGVAWTGLAFGDVPAQHVGGRAARAPWRRAASRFTRTRTPRPARAG